jgi:hypothetical protein
LTPAFTLHIHVFSLLGKNVLGVKKESKKEFKNSFQNSNSLECKVVKRGEREGVQK